MPKFDAREIYNSDKAIRHYSKMVAVGLYPYEVDFAKHLDQTRSILTIGCGTGREVFALEQLGYISDGCDNSSSQIISAQQFGNQLNSRARFFNYDFSSQKNSDLCRNYDAVWLTIGLTGHVIGRKNRVDGFHQLKSVCKTLVYLPDIYPTPWSIEDNQLKQYYQNLFDDAEPGDTFRLRFAKKLKFEEPVKYHYYLSHNEAISEFEDAGWRSTYYNESGYVLTQKGSD